MRWLMIIMMGAVCLNFMSVQAQNGTLSPLGQFEQSVLDFSQTSFVGSARTLGLGGAQTSLGGDISSILSNPAGLGLFLTSEVSISGGVNFNTTSTDFLGLNTDDDNLSGSFNSIGVVIAKTRDLLPGAWRGGSFGISITRTNAFRNQFSFGAVNDSLSLLDPLTAEANDFIDPEEFSSPAFLAFQTFLINADTNNVFSPISFEPPIQSGEVIRRGNQYQISLAAGGNIADRFYFGGTFGIVTVNFREERIFNEFFETGSLIDFTLTENLDISGVGFNGRFGIIARPFDFLRIGASIATPTFYNLNDNLTTSITANFEDGTIFFDEVNGEDVELGIESAEEEDQIEYNIRTPFRYNIGATIFLGKKGFFTADIERVNYTQGNFDSDDLLDDTTINDNISLAFRDATNIKLGVEARLDIFRFRAGYSRFGEAVNTGGMLQERRRNYTLGAGARLDRFFVDVTGVYSTFDEFFLPFDGAPLASINNDNFGALITAGFFF